MFNDLIRLPEFEKDFKKLAKRFKTLDEDFATFIRTQLNLYHHLNIDNGGVFEISDLGIAHPRIYKAKKFACRSLKGKGVRSGIRVIYAYHEDKDRIEFIEIYCKADQENEDRERVIRYYGE